LKGLPAFWFTLNMGLTSQAFDRTFTKDYLINRNIKTRVSNILLPGLEIDEDPYLVFDHINHTLYYALSIYTRLPLVSYAQSELLRYIGTVLLDVKTGTLDFVLNPQIDSTTPDTDPTFDLWKIYLDVYPWKLIEDSLNYKDWLPEQLRYPEVLFEMQLEKQYKYHVDDPNTWRGGSQFYSRPTDGDLFYVRFDLGEGDGLEYVGVDLVQRIGDEATTLAGMYVLRHGADHFGEVRFYSAIEIGQTNMIGPNTAQQSLVAAATQELALIENEDYGNVLLYPLGTSLYYFVPVYTSESNQFQVLKIAGFVNAFNALDVVYGESAEEAYELLNISITEEFESGNVTMTYEIDDTTLENDILIDILVKSNDINFTLPATSQAVQVNLIVESDIINVTLPWDDTLDFSLYNYSIGGVNETGYNYTIFNTGLNPLEGYSTTLRMSADLGSVYSSTIRFKLVLIVDGVVYEPDFYEYITFFK